MRTCEEYRVQISALMDNELTGKERLEVMAHMAECPACAQYFQKQLAIRDAIGELETVAPAGFAEGVMARVRETVQDKPISAEKKTVTAPYWRRWVATAACCAIAAVGVWAAGLLPGNSVDDAAMQSADVAFAGVATYSAASATDDAMFYAADMERCSEPVAADMQPATADNAAPTAAAEKSLAHTDVITTSSAVAKTWVEANLGEQWIPGCGYEVTKEQFTALRDMLEQAGEPYTLEDGKEEALWYLVAAE